MSYRLLDAFKGLFDGQPYLHRKSNLGDHVALQLFEDLYEVRRSRKYADRVDTGLSVLNVRNLRRGIQARRGDGTFGGIVPHSESVSDDGFAVRRGQIATIEIGIEVKIMMKAMIKQIDRVINDLKGQSREFGLRNGNPIRAVAGARRFAAHGDRCDAPRQGVGAHAAPRAPAPSLARLTATSRIPRAVCGVRCAVARQWTLTAPRRMDTWMRTA